MFLSASQINDYNLCARRWGFARIANIKSPPTPALKLGIDVDEGQLQPYLRDGRPLDLKTEAGQIANVMLEWLPPPKQAGELQKPIELPSPSWSGTGLYYRGYQDLWTTTEKLPGFPEPGLPAVVDFKTTTDWQWVKTPEILRTDAQAIIYATNALLSTGASRVGLRWLYSRTRGARRAKPIDVILTGDEVAPAFERIDAIGQEIVQLRKKIGEPKDPIAAVLDLPFNAESCSKFGKEGCPYQSRCNLSPAEKSQSIAANAVLRSQMNQQEATEDLVSRLARLKARAEGSTPPAPVATVEAPKQEGINYLPSWTQTAAEPEALPFNPPESLLPPPKLEIPAPPVEEAAEPKKRGRKPGSKNKPKGDEVVVTDVVVAEEEAEIVGLSPLPAPGENPHTEAVEAPAYVEATWGPEQYQPVPFNHFVIGPFKATGYARNGETRLQAIERLMSDLRTFASAERDRRAADFAKIVGST